MYKHSVSDLPAIDGAKIQNAIIEYADLMIEDHGFLSSFIGVVFDGSGPRVLVGMHCIVQQGTRVMSLNHRQDISSIVVWRLPE